MMIPSNYDVNVARITYYPREIPRFVHFCTIELGDIPESEAKAKFDILKQQFTGTEWKLMLRRIQCAGRYIEEV